MRSRTLTRLFGRCARPAVLTNRRGEAEQLMAVITPLRYKNRMYSDGEHGVAGVVDGGHFALICRYTPFAAGHGDTVTASGGRYTIRRWDVLYLGKRPELIWAVLSSAGGEG